MVACPSNFNSDVGANIQRRHKEINYIAESGEQYVPRGISYLVPVAGEWRPI